jgi:hypothetical protein
MIYYGSSTLWADAQSHGPGRVYTLGRRPGGSAPDDHSGLASFLFESVFIYCLAKLQTSSGRPCFSAAWFSISYNNIRWLGPCRVSVFAFAEKSHHVSSISAGGCSADAVIAMIMHRAFLVLSRPLGIWDEVQQPGLLEDTIDMFVRKWSYNGQTYLTGNESTLIRTPTHLCGECGHAW